MTVDPNGFPLVYIGSRDGFFRVLAFDREMPTELWRLSATDVSPTKWNDDWDGGAIVLGDYLFEGGENSQMHVVKLNRSTGPDGTVTVAPALVWVASDGPEWEKKRPRAAEVGQMIKLDPHRADDPLAWSQHDQSADKSGVWGTPGIAGDLVIFTTYSGRAVGIDRATGVVRWEKRLPAPLMGSPSIVDGVWFQGDCEGVLHAYDVRDPAVDPPELWQVPLDNCIESTPAVWNGRLYVGTRGGFMFGVGDQ